MEALKFLYLKIPPLPTVCGYLKDFTHSWKPVHIAFIAVSITALGLGILLKWVDSKNEQILDQPFIKKQVKT